MPIEYPNNIGSYLGKYLNKDDQGREQKNWANVGLTKGVRRVSYGRKEIKTHSANFNWVKHPQGRDLFRHKLKEWAEYRGLENVEEIKRAFGKNWSYHYYQEIMFDVPRKQRESQGFPPLSETWGRREPKWSVGASPEQYKDYFKPLVVERTNWSREKRLKEAWEYKQKFPWKFDEGV
jgi:hypothetical protein